MASPLPLPAKFSFGAFELDVTCGELRKADHLIKLQPQAIRVLILLVQHSGRVVTREEIRANLWRDDTFVDFDRSINFCINQIRSALSDNAENPRLIETLPRRGYRFLVPVTVVLSREGSSAAASTTSADPGIHLLPARSTESGSPTGLQVLPSTLRPTTWSLRRWLALVVAVLVAGLAVGAGIHRWLIPENSSLRDLRMSELTHSGAVTGVAISPDSRYVAYAKLTGDKQSLWLRQIAAQTDLQILTPGPGFHGLTFSPDGNFIYFVRSDEENPYFKYLYSVPAIGGSVKKLFTDVDSPVSFSPDGNHFVFEHCVEGRDDIEVRIAPTEGGEDRVLVTLHNASSSLFQPGPAWSPDGRAIAIPIMVLGSQQHWGLEVVSASDGSEHQLLSRGPAIGRPVWWRNDLLFVPFYEPEENRGQLWTVSFPDGKLQRFTNDLTSYGSTQLDYGFPLDRSHDGLSLVALATKQNSSIWIAPVAAPGKATRLTNNEPPLTNIAEAADGKLWASSEDGQLWIMNHDGTQGANYGKFRRIETIEPCGPFMLLLQGTALTRLDADAKHPFDLATGGVVSPSCSPDHRFVFYGTFGQPQKIWRVPIEGGTRVEIASILGDQITSSLSISHDGTLIGYAYDKFVPSLVSRIAIISARDGAPIRTFAWQHEGSELRWAPGGKAVQYLVTRKGVTNIWEQPLSGGPPRQLTSFDNGLIFDFNWSRDWKRLLLTRGEVSSDAILLNSAR